MQEYNNIVKAPQINSNNKTEFSFAGLPSCVCAWLGINLTPLGLTKSSLFTLVSGVSVTEGCEFMDSSSQFSDLGKLTSLGDLAKGSPSGKSRARWSFSSVDSPSTDSSILGVTSSITSISSGCASFG